MGVGSSLKMLSKLSKVADDVVESGAKYATKGGVAKNVTNSLASNMTKGNVKAVQAAGAEMVDAVKNEGKRTANKVINSKTAQKALDNFNGGGTGLNVADDVIHPEVAATYTRGGGSRGRSGSGGYNNRHNYGKGGKNQVHLNNKNKVNKAEEYQRYVNKNKRKVNAEMGNQSEFIPAQAESTLDVDLPEGTGNRRQRRQGNRQTVVNRRQTTAPEVPEIEVEPARQRRQGNGTRTQQSEFRNKTQPEVEPQFDTGGGGNTGGPETGGPNQGNNKRQKARERMNSEQFRERFGDFGEQAKDTFFGGIKDSYDNIRTGQQGFFEAIGNAHMNDDGSLNARRIGGTFMTVSAAGRIASGGGLYKDRYGNPNLIGVPFI